ncbi:MAG: cyclic nucleotide-binding domain-containing protein [Nitrospina sp.]|nr:cyclic nucleotide-binding domain-containing protein [Nitrospina sp.]
MEKVREFLDSIRFFKSFSDDEKRRLSNIKNIYLRFLPGEPIILEGQIEQALYVVLKGNAVVNKKGLEGLIISCLGPGSVFGEISLIQEQPRTTNVIAEGEVVVMKMEKATVETLDDALQKKFNEQLIRVLVERLEEMNQKYINAMFFNL